MKNWFVIVTHQRSGSNMLVSMLNNHPEIRCFNELMRPTARWMKRDGYRGALRILEKVDAAFQKDRYRFGHPYEFVHAAFKTVPKKKLCGFKFHIVQHPKFLSRLIKDPDCKIIVLQRDNRLAQFSSKKIARITGQGSIRKGTKVIHAVVKFRAWEFKRYVKRMEKEWKRVKLELSASGKQYLNLQYTDLFSRQVVHNMFEFLEVDPSVHVEPRTVKRNSSEILSRFSNPDKAAETIVRMGFEQWSHEAFKSREG
jgi:Sulfotransferase family